MSSSSNIDWTGNSVVLYSRSQTFSTFAGIVLAIACIILIHSFFLYRRKIRSIRVCTELTSTLIIAQSSCYIAFGGGNDRSASAFVINIFAVSVCGLFIQLCDNYVVFERFTSISGITNSWYHRTALIYVMTLLCCTWWPFYTFGPMLANLNNGSSAYAFYISKTWVLYCSYLIYNIFLMMMLLNKLRERLIPSISFSRRLAIQIIGVKVIMHNIVSAGAITAYCFWPVYGVLTFSLCVVISLHLLFNCKIESLFLKSSLGKYINISSQAYGRNSSVRVSVTQVTPVKHFVVGFTFPVSARNTYQAR